MALPDIDTLLGWRGRTVHDRSGEKIGKIDDLYLHEATDRPAYASVRSGPLGTKASLVPLDGMTEVDDDAVQVPYDAELVRDAPDIRAQDGVLSEEHEQALGRHYRTARPPLEDDR